MMLRLVTLAATALSSSAVPLAASPSLAILHADPALNATAAIVARVVRRKSGCRVVVGEGAPAALTLTLSLDPALGPEAYSTTFDGRHAAAIRGGDRMAVTFGAGAFLRAARFSPAGLTPPQNPPPPPPPSPLVPITNKWQLGAANHSYDYGACPGPGGSPGGCALSPLLGITASFEECKQLCLSTNITRCTACGWIPELAQWSKRCFARHDAIWVPSPVPISGAVWARRYTLPLPPPPPPPPLPPPPPIRPWAAASQPATPGSFRGLYFATHFGNFFANAPPAEIHEYLQDMALWGANTLVVIGEAAKFENFVALRREKHTGGSGGSLEPPGPLLETPEPIFTHFHTIYMA
jgi:hypothetical protein